MTHDKLYKKLGSWSPEEIAYLQDHYPSEGTKKCADALGRNNGSIKTRTRLMGLRFNRSTNVRADLFVNVTTPEAAYLLGLIWADGHVRKKAALYDVALTIAELDGDELEPVFASTGKWTITRSPSKAVTVMGKECQSSPTVRYITAVKELHALLTDLGYQEKSGGSAARALRHVPDHLRHYWYRGLFDGDGCITLGPKSKFYQRFEVSVASVVGQDWGFFTDMLDSLGAEWSLQTRGGDSSASVMRLTKPADIIKLRDYIYQGSQTIGLTRKREKMYLVTPRGRDWLTFEEARLVAKSNGLATVKLYQSWGSRPSNMPSYPAKVYKDEWRGWTHFLNP